jgi:DNA-binding IclR family transcriptional regulator
MPMTNVPAASRALLILRTLAKAGAPMPAAAIATRVGIPRSSTYHLLTAMQESGFVMHFPEDERWGLGVGAFELGSAYLRHDPLERQARPLLTKLVRETETKLPAVAQLGILQGSELLYLAREVPHRPVTLVTEVGVRLPAHLTASGRAILSGLDAAQVRATFANNKSFVDRTGLGPKNLRELTTMLRDESAAGFSAEDGFITEGYSSLAVAAKNHLGIPVAAIALTFRSEDAEAGLRSDLAVGLRSAGAELSKRLGGH